MPLYRVTPKTALHSDSGIVYSAAPKRFPGCAVLTAGGKSILLTAAQWAQIRRTVVAVSPNVRPPGA
jgi:hypothetical protein